MTHIVTRGLTALAVGGLSSLIMTGAAHAAPSDCGTGTHYTGTGCQPDTISATTTTPGGTVTVTAGGFAAGSGVMATVCEQDAGTLTADGNGTVAGNITIPDSVKPGVCTLALSGTGGNGAAHVVNFSLTIRGAGSASGLPFTGFELGVASLLGAGLLGAGTLAVVSGRKRKSALTTV